MKKIKKPKTYKLEKHFRNTSETLENNSQNNYDKSIQSQQLLPNWKYFSIKKHSLKALKKIARVTVKISSLSFFKKVTTEKFNTK